MVQPEAAVRGYADALKEPTPERLAALDDVLASDVVVAGVLGAGSGLEAVREAFNSPQIPGLLASATWSDPQIEGDTAKIEVELRQGMPISGFGFYFSFDAEGKVARVEQQMLPSRPPPATEVLLTPEIKDAVAGAITNGTPLLVAYVDAEGVPHLSLRGSVHAHNDTQLAMWIRDPEGGLLKAITSNPNLALFYRDPATRTTYNFTGRARVETDPHQRDLIYEHTPEPERNADARRLGEGVVIDLDRVEGMGPSGRVRMATS